jgi:hypothetical protein
VEKAPALFTIVRYFARLSDSEQNVLFIVVGRRRKQVGEMNSTGYRFLLALSTMAFVVSCAFAHVQWSSSVSPIFLYASPPPRETRISAFTNSEGHVYRLGGVRPPG